VELESQKLHLYQQLQARTVEAESQQAEITKLLEKYEDAVEKIGLLEGQLLHVRANQQDYMMKFVTVAATVERQQSELQEWSDWFCNGKWKDGQRKW
jgi:hypothetical protein